MDGEGEGEGVRTSSRFQLHARGKDGSADDSDNDSDWIATRMMTRMMTRIVTRIVTRTSRLQQVALRAREALPAGPAGPRVRGAARRRQDRHLRPHAAAPATPTSAVTDSVFTDSALSH